MYSRSTLLFSKLRAPEASRPPTGNSVEARTRTHLRTLPEPDEGCRRPPGVICALAQHLPTAATRLPHTLVVPLWPPHSHSQREKGDALRTLARHLPLQ